MCFEKSEEKFAGVRKNQQNQKNQMIKVNY